MGTAGPGDHPGAEHGEHIVYFGWSPDGRKLVGRRLPNRAIRTYSFDRKRHRSLTDFGTDPTWLSDSLRIVFWHDESLYLVDSESGKYHELFTLEAQFHGRDTSVSKDDRWIYFTRETNEADIWLMTLDPKR